MKKKITGSLFAKITAFILMVLFVGVGAFYGFVTVYALRENIYDENFDTWQENGFYRNARQDQYAIFNILSNGLRYEAIEDYCRGICEDTETYEKSLRYEAIEDYCRGRNLSVEIYGPDGDLLWGNYAPEDTDPPERYSVFAYADFPAIDDGGESVWENGSRIVVYVDTYYPYADDYYRIHKNAWELYHAADAAPVLAGGMLFLVILLFIFLMCSAGHHNEVISEEGDLSMEKAGKAKDILPGVLHGIWLDVLLGLFFFAMCMVTGLMLMLLDYVKGNYFINIWYADAAVSGWAMMIAFLGTLLCMELAIRIKCGNFLRYSLIGAVFRFLRRTVKAIGRLLCRAMKTIGRGIAAVIGMMPAMAVSLGCFAGLCFVEFIGFCWFGRHCSRAGFTMGIVFFLLEKIALAVLLCYFGIVRQKLWKAGEALAGGNLSYHVDTSKMILGYKKHGEHLNSISAGMTKAVTERMRSEHLKTELITNVSHDLKTPLTSIINYSELLKQILPKNSASSGEKDAALIPEDKALSDEEGKGAHAPDRVQTDMEKAGEYADVLYRQSIRLKKLLDDLLEVSKASTGNLTVEFVPCDIKVLITQITGEYEQRFEEKRLELLCSQPAEDICILADQRHMFRIFDNLFGNIYKYAQPGSRVYLSVEKEAHGVSVIFRNISEYPLNVDGQELTERFVRGDASRHKEGNGLGLSIAMSLVQLQKGTMNIVTDGDLFKAVLSFPVNG